MALFCKIQAKQSSDVLNSDFDFILKFNIWEVRLADFHPHTHGSHKHLPNDHEMFHFVVAESSKSIIVAPLQTSVFRCEIDFYVQAARSKTIAHYQQIQPVNTHRTLFDRRCLDCNIRSRIKIVRISPRRERLAFRSLTARYWVIMAHFFSRSPHKHLNEVRDGRKIWTKIAGTWSLRLDAIQFNL